MNVYKLMKSQTYLIALDVLVEKLRPAHPVEILNMLTPVRVELLSVALLHDVLNL